MREAPHHSRLGDGPSSTQRAFWAAKALLVEAGLACTGCIGARVEWDTALSGFHQRARRGNDQL